MSPFEEVSPTRLGKMLDDKQRTGLDSRPYLRNANVQWDRFDLNDVYEMDFDLKAREMFRLRDGDLLICEGGEPGRSAIWHSELPECYFQKALHRARPDLKTVLPEYLLFLMKLLSERGGLKDHVTVATIAHLTGEKLKRMKIPIPPLELQKSFHANYIQVKKLASRFADSESKTDQLFSSLQHRAFSGELSGG